MGSKEEANLQPHNFLDSLAYAFLVYVFFFSALFKAFSTLVNVVFLQYFMYRGFHRRFLILLVIYYFSLQFL